MANTAPASAALVAQSLPPRSELAPPLQPATVGIGKVTSSRKEFLFGTDGSWRRELSFLASALVVATAVRVACFTPGIFGNYLLRNLGPVERERVDWDYILGVRCVDLMLGSLIWKRVDGMTRKDGALFGALLACVSRVSLYAFEHAYFLLSTETTFTLLLTDVISLGSGFALLPYFHPHPPPSRAGLTAWKKLLAKPELIVNIVLASGLATTLGAFTAYIIEHTEGMEFVKNNVFELEVPAYLAKDTMTAAQMMAHPLVTIPSLRSFLTPHKMKTHILHSFLESIFAVPLVSILPALDPLELSILAFALIAPASTFLLWDVLPIYFKGAVGVGLTLALRGAVTAWVTAWVLEELRMTTHLELVELVVLDENEEKDQLEVVGVAEGVVEIEDEKADERGRL